ncbi:unnamed protein product [Amoebophrya sp. A120]|nr:unnamed protein product [Amoebophrya sp. A120]|eukprot:GSA120T00013063001.1
MPKAGVLKSSKSVDMKASKSAPSKSVSSKAPIAEAAAPPQPVNAKNLAKLGGVQNNVLLQQPSESGAASVRIDGRSNPVKHWQGNAMRYGDDEDSSELFVLLKNVYTEKHAHRPTYRVLGRLQEDGETGAQGLEWIDVPRKTDKFLKKSDEEIPAVLARLSTERAVRNQFEKELGEVYPVQYKPPKQKGKNDWESDFEDSDDGSEQSYSGSSSSAGMFQVLNLRSLSDELRRLLEADLPMQQIFHYGRSVFTGTHEDLVDIALPPANARRRNKFIPLKHEITEAFLVKEWAQNYKSYTEHSMRQKSGNKVILDKFVKLRPHVGYRFEQLDERGFEAAVAEVFPITQAKEINTWAAEIAKKAQRPNAPKWMKNVAQLEALREKEKASTAAAVASSSSAGPALKKQKK